MDRFRRILSMVVCTILYSTVHMSAQHYTVTELPMHVESHFHALGEDGSVAGTLRPPDGSNHPALWDKGALTTLPIDGMALSRNAVGQTVGLAYFPTVPWTKPLEWDQDGYRFWPQPAGAIYGAQVNAINDGGMGVCTFSYGNRFDPAWCTRAGFSILPGLGGSWPFAWDINTHGVAAGTADTPSGAQHVVVWDPQGQILDYGTLGGSWANGIKLGKAKGRGYSKFRYLQFNNFAISTLFRA